MYVESVILFSVICIVVVRLVLRSGAQGTEEEKAALLGAIARMQEGEEVFARADPPSSVEAKAGSGSLIPVRNTSCYNVSVRRAAQRAQGKWQEFEDAFASHMRDSTSVFLVCAGFESADELRYEWVVEALVSVKGAASAREGETSTHGEPQR